MKEKKDINWNSVLIETLFVAMLLFGLLAVGFAYKSNFLEEHSWSARVCFEDYNNCGDVEFSGQTEFIEFCNEENDWYQISSTTTCIKNRIWAEKEAKKQAGEKK